jgi:DNA-binding cell septation regulator SpoVG
MTNITSSNYAIGNNDDDKFMWLLKSAPIKELADYIGIDIDLAVQLRVDEAVSVTYRKLGKQRSDMDIAVWPITPQGNLYGFASVTVSGIRIDDFKILGNKNGDLFVGMPSKPDKTSYTGYRDTVQIVKNFRYDFNYVVIDKYCHAANTQFINNSQKEELL